MQRRPRIEPLIILPVSHAAPLMRSVGPLRLAILFPSIPALPFSFPLPLLASLHCLLHRYSGHCSFLQLFPSRIISLRCLPASSPPFSVRLLTVAPFIPAAT